MRQKRYPLLLDHGYPPERLVLEAIHVMPEGERASFLRALILLGHAAIENESRQQTREGTGNDGAAGTHRASV